MMPLPPHVPVRKKRRIRWKRGGAKGDGRCGKAEMRQGNGAHPQEPQYRDA